MTRPQEQFTELVHRTQEQFKQLWEQWNKKSTELMKGVGGRTPSVGTGAGNPEEVLDAVFDFAENLIEQQRAFAKQMLKAASQGQEMVVNAGDGTSGSPLSAAPSSPSVSPATSFEASQARPDAGKGR
jgi:hypothetical protein